MNATASIALSGLSAAQHQMQSSAHNVANLATDGFRRQQVVQSAAPGGGVTTSLAQADITGPSLETDMVGLLQGKNAFLANLAVFRASDATTGALLKAVA
ncbi:flagellar basal body protein [Ideonella sp. A 288]|uniref:flagellar basal body protein n=1 Tax=Ideonella sp. A 288 TaxID=1962181 RepID=UPI000B4A7D13|nr:flagellar basal body protein [Ideonella sp. A 288]